MKCLLFTLRKYIICYFSCLSIIFRRNFDLQFGIKSGIMDLDFIAALMTPSTDWGLHIISDISVTKLIFCSITFVWQGNCLASQSWISPDWAKERISSLFTLRKTGRDDNFTLLK